MGDKLNRRLLRRFIDVNGVYPIGQLVELDDGGVAIVRAQNASPLQPKVALLDSEHSQDLVEEEPRILDLADVACAGARSILRELTPDQARECLQRAEAR